MATDGMPIVDELDPKAAYDALSNLDDVALVDVRTRAEWTFIGIPDISATGKQFWPIEWVRFPDMSPNPAFLDELVQRAGGGRSRSTFSSYVDRAPARWLPHMRLPLRVCPGDARTSLKASRVTLTQCGIEGG